MNKINVWADSSKPLTTSQILNVWTDFYNLDSLAMAVSKSPRTFTPNLAITDSMSKVDESEILMLRSLLADAGIPFTL